jgi:hypothetical protein
LSLSSCRAAPLSLPAIAAQSWVPAWSDDDLAVAAASATGATAKQGFYPPLVQVGAAGPGEVARLTRATAATGRVTNPEIVVIDDRPLILTGGQHLDPLTGNPVDPMTGQPVPGSTPPSALLGPARGLRPRPARRGGSFPETLGRDAGR